MKSEIKIEEKQAESTYPCLKKLSNNEGITIVLFVDPREGMCVHTTIPSHFVGDFSAIWGENAFEPFNGNVILTN